MLPQIIFVGWFNWPEGSAGSQYVYGLGLALRDAGYTVGHVADGTNGRQQDRQVDGSFAFNGFPYYPLGISALRTGWSRRLFPAINLSPQELTLQWLEAQDLTGVRHIFTYSGTCSYLLKLHAFCVKRGIILVNIIVEWYSPRQMTSRNPLQWCLTLLDSEMQRRWVNHRIGRLVCISRYLQEHYSHRGCSTVRVPHLLDLDDSKWAQATASRNDPKELRLVFAGSAGYKDLLHIAIRGLAMAGAAGKRVKLSICGPSRNNVARFLGRDVFLLEQLSEQLEFCGHLSHQEALAEVARADFSVMLRPNARFIRAGFPTKLGESLACGVPVLGNLTGDVELYVRDGIEGIVVPDCSSRSFAGGLVRALALSAMERQLMRDKAWQQAVSGLGYRNYAKLLRDFLERGSRLDSQTLS